jgi:predicted ATPase
MINSLHLINFKPFEDRLLEFRPLTLLSELNSTGKSSVLQSLLLLRQSYKQGLLSKKGLALNGDLVNIGTAQDALFEGATKDIIGFNIIWKNQIEREWFFNYDRELDVLSMSSEPVSLEVYTESLFTDKFHYLQAERIGSRKYYEMLDFQVKEMKNIGTQGEYTAYFLLVNEKQSIFNSKLSHPNAKMESKGILSDRKTKSQNLIDQVEAWMGEISPGTRIKISPKSDVDLISMQYSYKDSKLYRATNVGFGISYTLPIIVAVLASEPGTLILLENPEAHLHPKGQSKMGELLALAASCGVQIIVETHSDHLLNGIRLAVHDGKIEPEDVQLHYFKRKEEEGMMVSEVTSPKIDKNGRIDRWPDGFFDEWRNMLSKLI